MVRGNDIVLSISCEGCSRRGTPDCVDCLVTHVLGAEETLALSAEDARVADLLGSQGLVPPLRYRADASRRPGGSLA